MAILLAGFSQSLLAQTDYYWNSGAQTTPSWNVASNWRTGSVNGTVSSAVPTSADNVFFSNSSATVNPTIIVSQASAARNFNYSSNSRQITLQVNSILEIAGSMTIANGSGNNKLSITTAATPTAINAGTVAIRFTSAVATTIQPGGTNTTVFNAPVVFDGAGKWSLSDNNSMTIGHSARFTRGHVVALPSSSTGANNPLPPYNANQLSTSTPKLIFTSTATASGGSNASHVIGYVQKETIPSGSFKFIIGDGTYYRPLVSNEPTSSILTTRYLSINPVSPDWRTPITYQSPLTTAGGVSNREFWYYDANGNSAPSVTMDANHPDPAIANYYRLDRPTGLTVGTVQVSNSGNASWDSRVTSVSVVDNPAPTPDSYNVVSGGLSNARVWITLARVGNTSLPVRLVSFTGQQLEGQVQLKWQSSSEENTSHFEVERSADGKNFSQLLTKKAQGNSTTLVSYNAIDNSPLGGTSYYRLKMVDLDGTFEYSKLVAVSAAGTLQVQAYPNPSKGNGINLVAGNGSKLVLKSVSDLFGKQVSYQQRNAGENLQVNFAQPLPAGFYVATLAGSDNGELVKVKFVVQ